MNVLMTRRRVMMESKGESIANLLDYADAPNGSHTRPAQYFMANYPITSQIEAGARVHFKIEFATNYEGKTGITLYNTDAKSAGLLASMDIVNGVAQGDFSWVVYSTNNSLRVYATPNSSSLPTPTAAHAELYVL